MAFINKLRYCSLFHDLMDEEIESLVKKGKVLHYQKDTFIAKEGESINELGIVLEGKASIVKEVGGRTLEIQDINEFDFFGEVIFSNDTQYYYHIVAEGHVTVLSLSFDDFLAFFNKSPKAFGIFMMNILRNEQEKIRVAAGLVARVMRESDISVRTPLFGNMRLTEDQILKIKEKTKKLKAS